LRLSSGRGCGFVLVGVHAPCRLVARLFSLLSVSKLPHATNRGQAQQAAARRRCHVGCKQLITRPQSVALTQRGLRGGEDRHRLGLAVSAHAGPPTAAQPQRRPPPPPPLLRLVRGRPNPAAEPLVARPAGEAELSGHRRQLGALEACRGAEDDGRGGRVSKARAPLATKRKAHASLHPTRPTLPSWSSRPERLPALVAAPTPRRRQPAGPPHPGAPAVPGTGPA
jgi:hypothetical protein